MRTRLFFYITATGKLDEQDFFLKAVLYFFPLYTTHLLTVPSFLACLEAKALKPSVALRGLGGYLPFLLTGGAN